MFCLHVVSTCSGYMLCLHVLSTCCVYMFCLHVLSTWYVYMFWVHVMSTCSVYMLCLHAVSSHNCHFCCQSPCLIITSTRSLLNPYQRCLTSSCAKIISLSRLKYHVHKLRSEAYSMNNASHEQLLQEVSKLTQSYLIR